MVFLSTVLLPIAMAGPKKSDGPSTVANHSIPASPGETLTFDLPTGSGLEISGWFGICGPRGMPEEAVARWAEAIRRGLEGEAVRRRMLDSGLTPAFEDTATFARTIQRDRSAWGEVIRAANIRAE